MITWPQTQAYADAMLLLPSTHLLHRRRIAAAFSILVFAAALKGQNTLTTTGTQRYFNAIRKNLEAAAEVMPAEKYAFRLTDGQMTFAEWLNHSTERNYMDCSTLKGESVPAAAKQSAALKEKVDVMKALKDSFYHCAGASLHFLKRLSSCGRLGVGKFDLARRVDVSVIRIIVDVCVLIKLCGEINDVAIHGGIALALHRFCRLPRALPPRIITIKLQATVIARADR